MSQRALENATLTGSANRADWVVTAYYDFNYVYFHDGYQATLEDLLFTYHLDALDPKTIALDVL